MAFLSHDNFDLLSANHVPDSYSWPSSYLHDHPTNKLSSSGGNFVPIIDISGPNAAALVSEACRSCGVFYATGHGVPESLLHDVEYQARRLFSLPLHQKLLAARLPGVISGYGRPPLSSFFPKLMWSEGFTIAGNPRDVSGNIWPHGPSNFCDVLEEYNKKMKEVAGKILNLMLLSLGLTDEVTGRVGLMDELAQLAGVLQLNSYPLCPEPDKAIGMAAHTDSGLFTVLHQSGGTHGLQVLHRVDGSGPAQWVTVPPLPEALVIHVADLLQILSNGQFKSVRHRAVVSQAEHRISAAYIIGPLEHVKVGPISKLFEPVQLAMYRPVTWPEYLEIRARLFDKALESVELREK